MQKTMFLILALLFSNVSFADSNAVQAGAGNSTPWKSEENTECGQSCLYLKANETIALQSLYLFNRLKFLSEENKKGNDLIVKQNLKGFCLPTESAPDCFQRYKKLQTFAMIKMRSAIIANTSAAASLMGKNVPTPEEPMGSQRSHFVRYSDGKPKKPQVPYVLTFEDLQREYKQIQKLSSTDYDAWTRSLPFKPSKEDYVKFKSIPKDPEHPEAGSLNVIQKDESGNIVYDVAAFEQATKSYEQQIQAELIRQKDRPVDDRPQGDLIGSTGHETRSAFIESRRPVVDAANKAIRGKAQPQALAFPGNARTPAGTGAAGASAATAIDKVDAVMPMPEGQDRAINVDLAPEEIGRWIKEVEALP